jgi:protein-S-isoprenylcysteine O-methyltransferase Ste14
MYFIFSGSFVVVSLVAMVTLVKETLPLELRARREPRGKRLDVGGFLASVRSLGQAFAVFLVAILLYRTGYTMMDPFFSIYLREVLALDLSSTSYLFALRAICTMVFAPVAVTALYFVVIRHRLLFEERMLVEEFGDEYREYMQKTKRLIPYVY